MDTAGLGYLLVEKSWSMKGGRGAQPSDRRLLAIASLISVTKETKLVSKLLFCCCGNTRPVMAMTARYCFNQSMGDC